MIGIKHIEILDEAVEDLEDGRSFYNNQEQGIGDYFWDSLISDIESLIIYAGVHAKEYGYFRMPSKRFPYSIYYEVKEQTAYIVAILPMRKNPNWIKKRINETVD